MARRTTDLEAEDTWDFDNAERRPGTKAARSVVSVAFPRDDFTLVAEQAERAQMKLSEFIRTAAVKAATHQREHVTVFATSGTPGFASFTVTAPTANRGKVYNAKVEVRDAKVEETVTG